MNTMNRETLRRHLHNTPLVQAIEQKRAVDEMKKRLAEALQTLREAGASALAADEAQRKFEEYRSISAGYSVMLEDIWSITWQAEGIIKKYTNCCDDDIDRLPEHIKFD